jgi:hypothetical protein
MALGFGVRETAKQGRLVRACAVPPPRYKAGGVTLDWSTVSAVSGADKTLTDDRVVKIGEKFIRYGTVICRMNIGEIVVLALPVGTTGGTFTITIEGVATGALAWNASLATVQAAIDGLSTVEPGEIVVSGTPGTSYTLTFDPALGNVAAVTADGALLTGGATTITPAVTAGAASGTYGPYAVGATDGRAVLRVGDCYIVDETVVDSDPKSLYAPGGVFDGGMVFLDRVMNNGNDLLGNPTRAQMTAAFPGCTWVED